MSTVDYKTIQNDGVKMSRRVNVRTRIREPKRTQITGRTPNDSQRNLRYDIGTPHNYKNERYKEV